MPMYWKLKHFVKDHRERTVKNLQRLRKQLDAEIPPRSLENTLLLATWNLRDFDSNKFGHGPRLTESFHYIAEIISRFDIVALQEVNDDLKPLERLLELLGPWWDYITTDVTAGTGGNNERGTILFDRRTVRFKNVAGEIVLPKNMLIQEEEQFSRTPYLVSFQSSWFKFSLCTVHLYYGADSGDKLNKRIAEIERIANFLAKRNKAEESNLILLGDFNIVSPEHKTMQALLNAGFHVPDELRHKTNMMGTKYYDQIAFMLKKNELQMATYSLHKSAGAFNFYKSVFPPSEWKTYYDLVKDDPTRDGDKWKKNKNGQRLDDEGRKKYYTNEWRTWQMSDHLPLWVALKIDFSDQYLKQIS
jgi:endonuclease/exonuclease/phosphatase family metal-dependent hydrolase